MQQITISYSELQSMRRCRFKHRTEYINGYRREQSPTSALGFGTAWHEVLNAYYERLQRTSDGAVLSSPWRAGKEVIARQPEEIQEPLRWMLEGYSAYYGMEKGWRVTAVERKIIQPLPQLADDLKINLKCKIDLVITDRNDRVWVDDHKSKGQLPAASAFRDPQLPLYMWAWNQEFQLRRAYGARYSYALKPGKRKRPLEDDWDKRFRRTLVTYTDHELFEIACDAYRTAYDVYTSQFLPPPRSLSPDCSWCDYKDPCRLSLRGRDLTQGLTDYGFSSWRDEPKQPQELEEQDA